MGKEPNYTTARKPRPLYIFQYSLVYTIAKWPNIVGGSHRFFLVEGQFLKNYGKYVLFDLARVKIFQIAAMLFGRPKIQSYPHASLQVLRIYEHLFKNA